MSCKLVSLKAFSMQVVSDCCMSILSKIVTVQYQNENMDVLSLNFVTAQVGRNYPKMVPMMPLKEPQPTPKKEGCLVWQLN